MVDKLEAVKNQNPPVDAIVDDVAAKAYVEEFAIETFLRADSAIHTDQATKQTIDTFQAASTFFELLDAFGTIDPDIHAKIKYAKYHALRIAKAIKAGEDPNATNPKDDVKEPGFIDENEIRPASNYSAPTVESVPDVALPGSDFGEIPRQPESHPQNASSFELPGVPDTAHDNRPITRSLTTAPTIPTQTPASTPTPLQRPSDQTGPILTPSVPASAPPTPKVSQEQFSSSTTSATIQIDDAAIAQAQKHAKWAISALNFDDVPTAVKELKIALSALGAV